jgi:cytochrome c-type biogenesis protein
MQTAWLETLSTALQGAPAVALAGAFGWGLISVLLSPCHLAAIPLIVGFLSTQDRVDTRRATVISSAFAGGLLVTIGLVGGLTVLVGRTAGDVGGWINYAVAALFFAFGLNLLGVFELPSLRGVPTPRRRGAPAALLLGLVFGLVLGPCTFAFLAPVLGAAFAVASQNILFAAGLTLAFGIGHCGVIVVAGSSAALVQRVLDWNGRSGGLAVLRRLSGVLVLFGGLYLLYLA